MVKIKNLPHINPDRTINLEAWLKHTATLRSNQDLQLIRHACVLSQLTGEDKPTLTGISCLNQGLTMAEILLDLHLDAETIAAAIVYSSVHYGDLSLDDVREHLGENVAKLVQGTVQMEAIRTLPSLDSENNAQLENVRNMLLAMVQDMRVVIIKLAERTSIMRTIQVFDAKTCQQIAQETMDIYAPLANRLGIGQLKWELEDLAFRYLDPAAYKETASRLHETRIEREQYIQHIVERLERAMRESGIEKFDVSGRVKHIYSIYRKMMRKKISFDQVFDLNAVRVLVSTIDECYAVLSIIHTLWKPLDSEFDDYITSPKPNGYRSIHAVVIGPNHKKIEIQIRTYEMHRESEHGVAAHWQYKEDRKQKADYHAKIAWLRQVLDWQKELVKSGATPHPVSSTMLDDRVYVFTPAGAIIDLPQGATPLDFAYQIHSEIGHRCRGAKVNGNLVSLTYTLNTGEQVEILTAKHPNPSRDWLNSHLGYLKTARAKAKVHHWFRLQDYDKNVIDGQALLERECHRLGLPNVDFEQISHKLHYKNKKDMFAALGGGDLRTVQVLNAIQSQLDQIKKSQDFIPSAIPLRSPSKSLLSGISIAGVGDLLTHTTRCCKAVPGDAIIGFITRGRGVAIHRNDCTNIINMSPENRHRLVEVNWGTKTSTVFPVDIYIRAHDRPGLLRDITTLIANEKLNLIAINTTTSKIENMAHTTLTIEINSLASLSKILDRIKHIPNVIEAKRNTENK